MDILAWLNANIVEAVVIPVTVVVLGAFGREYVDRFYKKRELRVRNKYIQSFGDTELVINILKESIRDTEVERVLLFRGSNSGGEPKPGEPYYAQLIYGITESIEEDLEIAKRYDKIPVDTRYYSMLKTMIMEGRYKFVTADEAPGLLKDIYETDFVKTSILYCLHMTPKNLYYVSFENCSADTYSKETLVNLDIEYVPKLKTIIKRYQ